MRNTSLANSVSYISFAGILTLVGCGAGAQAPEPSVPVATAPVKPGPAPDEPSESAAAATSSLMPIAPGPLQGHHDGKPVSVKTALVTWEFQDEGLAMVSLLEMPLQSCSEAMDAEESKFAHILRVPWKSGQIKLERGGDSDFAFFSGDRSAECCSEKDWEGRVDVNLQSETAQLAIWLDNGDGGANQIQGSIVPLVCLDGV